MEMQLAIGVPMTTWTLHIAYNYMAVYSCVNNLKVSSSSRQLVTLLVNNFEGNLE